MRPFLTVKDHFHSQEYFNLVYDETLDMLITRPQPTNPAPYYCSDNYISHSDQSTSLIDKIYGAVRRYSLVKKLRLINSLVPHKGSLLDIGAGTGEFLLAAQRASWKVTGIEPNPLAQSKALNKALTLHKSFDDIPNLTFDVITLWHVLEHLPNLTTQLQTISRLLKPNGVLVVAVPNYKSYDARKYQEFWAAYDVPRHFWHFSKTSIKKLFLPLGFTLHQIQPMWFDSFYVSLLSEKYKTGKHHYISAFVTGLRSNLSGLFSKEYSSHIYVLRNSKNRI